MSLEIMIKIQIDGNYYEADSSKNLLETCLALGMDIPHFCYHGALGSVGACRLCAVKKFRNADDMKGLASRPSLLWSVLRIRGFFFEKARERRAVKWS